MEHGIRCCDRVRPVHYHPLFYADTDADAIICSGAYSEKENQLDIDYCKKYNSNVYSHFSSYGNLGPSNVFFGIIKALEFIQKGSNIIDVIDRDVFGRESIIRVEKC